MASADIQVQTGRKWNAALDVAESRLSQKALVASIATERAIIGCFTSTRVDNVLGKECQHLIQEEVWAGVEEIQASRMVGMG